MPLRNEPPRPSDGVGRQAIRPLSTPSNGRPDRRETDRLLTGRRRAAEWLLVILVAYLVVEAVEMLVGGPLRLVGLSVALAVGCALALVVFLVASRSGGQR